MVGTFSREEENKVIWEQNICIDCGEKACSTFIVELKNICTLEKNVSIKGSPRGEVELFPKNRAAGCSNWVCEGN